MPAQRDPVSELLDAGARSLLQRAYDAPRGEWVSTRLADPSDRHRAWARSLYGIDLDGPDNAPTKSGKRQDAHTRWGRAFVRALYFNHKWYGYATPRRELRGTRRMSPNGAPLQIEWGRRMPVRGIIPAGRAVRIRLAKQGGQTALRAVHAKRDIDRTWTDDGGQGGRFSQLAERDWA